MAWIIAIILGLGLPAVAEAGGKAAKNLARRFDPIEISGKDLAPLLGKPLDRLLLYVSREGKFEPIPFQFDEKTADNKYILTEGLSSNPQAANKILDPQDVLVFMVSDSGDQAEEKDYPAGHDQTLEIEIRDRRANTQAWVYLYSFADKIAQPNFKPKVYLEPDKEAFVSHGQSWMFEGHANKFGKTISRTVMPKRFYTEKSAGGNGVNILDRLKARARASLLFGALNFSFHENNFSGGVTSFKQGPIRCFGPHLMQLNFSSGLRGPKFWQDTYIYDYFIFCPFYIKVQLNPGYVMTEFDFKFVFDLNESALGMKIYNSNNLKGFTVDGKMSPAEKNFTPDADLWRAIVGPQGSMIFANFWDPRFQKQAIIQTYFNDDKNIEEPPEDVPGNLGVIGFGATVDSLEPGEYTNLVAWFMPPDFYDPKGLKLNVIQEFLDIRFKPLEISVNKKPYFSNTAGFPSRLHN